MGIEQGLGSVFQFVDGVEVQGPEIRHQGEDGLDAVEMGQRDVDTFGISRLMASRSSGASFFASRAANFGSLFDFEGGVVHT